LPGGLELGPFDGGELDTEEADVDGLGLAGADDAGVVAVAVGSAVLLGRGSVDAGVARVVALAQVVPGTTFLTFSALRLAVPVEVAMVPVLVVVAVAGPLLVAVAVGPLLVPVLVGDVPLVVPPTGLVAELAGATLGVDGLVDWACAAGDGAEVVGHAVAWALLPLALLLAGLLPPVGELARVPVPDRLGVLLLGLCEEIPATSPIWTRAWRVGGNASATPMANTAAPTAKTGRSSPVRQSRGWRRACRLSSRSPRPVRRRRVRSARKPPEDPAQACLPARAGPAWTRARIRSRPSEPGSTWSAAACSARRNRSANSCPCGGVPSWPGLLMTPAPGRRGGRSCRAPCGF